VQAVLSVSSTIHICIYDFACFVCSGVEMEAGSCALSQGNAKCGLSGGAVDTLNVEHELSRWLQDLDAASSTVSRSLRAQGHNGKSYKSKMLPICLSFLDLVSAVPFIILSCTLLVESLSITAPSSAHRHRQCSRQLIRISRDSIISSLKCWAVRFCLFAEVGGLQTD